MSALAWVACAAFSVEPATAKRPDGHFRRAVQALDRGDWDLAEQELRRAIQLDGAESARKISITGLRYESYLPHYYLGLALYRRGDLEGARTAWAESRSQGAIAEWRDAPTFERQWAKLVDRIGPPPPPPPPPSPAARLELAVRGLEAKLRECPQPTTPLVTELVAAAEALGEARRAEGANSPEPAALEAAARRVEQATTRLQSALARPARSPREVAGDLRALVGRVRAEKPAGADVEDSLVSAEIELSRNAPDLESLKRHEATLLRLLYPVLAED